MAAINRGNVDRPPFDFWAEDSTMNRLFEYLGHRDIVRFLDENDVDIRGLEAISPPPVSIGNGLYQNMWGERFVLKHTEWGDVREDTHGALSKARTFDDLRNFPWPSNDDIDFKGFYEKCCKVKDKELAIRYGFADVWQRPMLVRSMENHLADMAENPDWVHYLSRVFTDFYLEDYRRAWEESKGKIDIFTVYSDVGSQRGPLISLDMFNSFVAPYLKEIADEVHRFGAKLLYHTCGDISRFIPVVIDCGVDILDPIQPVCEAMRPGSLKKYPLCYHGGIDIQKLLPHGTPGQIKAEVVYYSEEFGTGYIACPAHLFQPDTPPENIVAFYKAFE